MSDPPARHHGLGGDGALPWSSPTAQLFDRSGRTRAGRDPRHPVRLPGQRRRHLGPGRRATSPPAWGGPSKPSTCGGLRARIPVRTEAALARLAAARWVFAGTGQPDLRPAAVGRARTCRTCWPTNWSRTVVWSSPAPPPSPSAVTRCRSTRSTRWAPIRSGRTGLDLLRRARPRPGRHPALRQRRGRHPRHPVLLPGRAAPGRAGGAAARRAGGCWASTSTPAASSTSTAGTASVVGNGVVTVRRAGSVRGDRQWRDAFPSVRSWNWLPGKEAAAAPLPPPPAPCGRGRADRPPRRDPPARRRNSTRRLRHCDVEGAVRAVLELDDTLVAWAGDTTQSDAGERGRAALRRMVVRLGELARTGARDPRQVVGGFVDALLAERAAARDDRRYGDADRVGTCWWPRGRGPGQPRRDRVGLAPGLSRTGDGAPYAAQGPGAVDRLRTAPTRALLTTIGGRAFDRCMHMHGVHIGPRRLGCAPGVVAAGHGTLVRPRPHRLAA